ncbi:MAG: DUF4838 domain-containing protein [Armatimonadetes bacterium]|nr:DUF4838 domain-containing protein [Armatimonadota bacterium]
MLRALLCLGILVPVGRCQALTLTQEGKSDYVVVVAAEASPSEQHAAEELQRFLREISGAELPIVGDDQPLAAHEIILGVDNAHLGQVFPDLPLPVFGKEGFWIRTAGERLIILGGKPRGTLYGVYAFLEDYLGCRWFSSKVSRIAKRPTIELGEINDTQVPALEYREPFYWDAFDGDWAARNKANSQTARLEEKHGGKITYYPFVHTFNNLIPPEQYFAEHPEYFSEIDGKRVGGNTQLCLTNPDVLRLTIAKVREWTESHPGVNIISVSQNDWGNYCGCANCAAIATAEESQAGPLVAFVNQVAEAIAQDYPDVAIDTLAYQYTRKPPKAIRPHPNVIIRLCSIECCFSHPLATCDYPQNVSFRDDIVGWSKLCDRLYVWDYVTSFANYLNPFPNWDVLGPNIRFFVDNGVKGIFEEGNYNSPGGELAELRAYIMAKCLWDPAYDPDRAMTEFLEGYYGPAAPPIRAYIDLLTAKVRDENLHMHIWEGPYARFLTEDVLTRANELLDEAERLAQGDPELLHRVQVARVPLLFVAVSRYEAPPRQTWTVRDGRFGPPVDTGFGAQVDRFFGIADAEGITCYHEGHNNFPALREAVLAKRGGAPVTPLKGETWEASIVPSEGARIVSLKGGDGAEWAAGGAAYSLSLSRSPEGPGARAAFVPVENLDPLQPAFTAELDGGLGLQREFRREADGLLVHSSLRNTGDTQRRIIVNETYCLDLGPADATVLEAVEGPLSLAIPEDEVMRHVRVSPETLRAGPVKLVNGVTKRAIALGPFGEDSTVTLTTAVGSVPLQVRSSRLVDSGPGGTTDVRTVLTPLPPAEAPAAERPREHHATVVEVQDDRFGLYQEGVLSEFALDETASDGWSARQLGSDHEWSIQWPIDPALFEAGATYTVSAIARIERKGDAGAALTFGVYDTVNRVGILNGGRSVAEMPEGWQTIEMGAFIPTRGVYVWTAPPLNGDNVAWVYVDRLVFRKVDQ